MGKEGDLWDDSALINALDDAISKYKTMHGKGHHASSTEEGNNTSSSKENLSALVDENEAKRHAEADDTTNIASNTTIETGEDNNLPPIEENHGVNSCAPGPYVDSSSSQHVQDAQGISKAVVAEDYNQLMTRYYELEDQRQKVLMQLHQYGSWDYQGSGTDAQWNSYSTSQEHQVPTFQASYPATSCTCCPCAYHCSSAPCSLGGNFVCSTCGTTSATGCDINSLSIENGDVVKTAMGVAERALSTLKTKTCNEKKEEINEVQMAHSTSSETDLTVVLNAWYSAGFYTGKYLVEQSIAKKGPA